MTLVNVADGLKSLKVLEAKTNWIKCPFCDDEVTRLRPCGYWVPVETVSHVCVECAESVKGLPYLAMRYPIPGVDVAMSLMPVYEKLPKRFISERSYKARVFYQDWGFMVWPDGSHLYVLEDRKAPDQKKSYDNTFQVWFALKKQFETGREEVETLPSRKGGWRV